MQADETHFFFRFKLPNTEYVLGNKVGEFLSLKYSTTDGKEIDRYFYPINRIDQKGYIDFMIRVLKDENGNPLGELSKQLINE